VRRILALCVVLALAGCGGSSNKSASGGGATTTTTAAGCAKSSLALVNSGQLTVGTDNPAYPPWFGGTEKSPWKVSDPRSGEGFESAVTYAVAKKLGFANNEVKWIVVPFNTSYAPGPKKFDFDINEISYTPARAMVVDFSDSYYDVNQAVVARKGTPIAAAQSSADLQKYKLGAQIGTTSYTYIKEFIKPSKQPAVFDTNDAAVAALKNGQIDGLVVDLPTAFYVTSAQVPNSKIVGQFPTGNAGERFGMVFQKGNQLVGCVNHALNQLKSDGTLQQIQEKWLAKVGGAPILH
jgi:polar amino acid transport system substrate-binding protein